MYDEILAKLTLAEKCRLINGVGSWYTYDCNKKIPWIMMTDGPHGLCKQEQDSFTKMERARSATCFPTTAAIANTWNTEAVAKLAQAIGEEAIEQGIDWYWDVALILSVRRYVDEMLIIFQKTHISPENWLVPILKVFRNLGLVHH